MKLLLVAATCLALGATGKIFYSQKDALALAFGKTPSVRQTHYWSKQERAEVAKLAGVKHTAATHAEYREKTVEGKAVAGKSVWFDTRIVRNKAQTIMLIVDETQRIEKLVVCRFDEPTDYKPVDRWYQQFEGRRLDQDLRLKKGIHGVSGATLTARSTTAAVREILAAHAVAHPARTEDKTRR